MIQRIQSVYLLLVAAIFAAMLFLPVFDASVFVQANGLSQQASLEMVGSSVIYVPALAVNGFLEKIAVIYSSLAYVLIALSIITVFLYKNRGRQLFFSRFVLIIDIAYLVLLYYNVEVATQLALGAGAQYHIGTFLPLFSPVLLLMAGRAIRRDIAIVKSSDRLR